MFSPAPANSFINLEMNEPPLDHLLVCALPSQAKVNSLEKHLCPLRATLQDAVSSNQAFLPQTRNLTSASKHPTLTPWPVSESFMSVQSSSSQKGSYVGWKEQVSCSSFGIPLWISSDTLLPSSELVSPPIKKKKLVPP